MRGSQTERALGAALKRMLCTTRLSKVSVSRLSAEAGVHRQTFYAHFRDVYDLAGWVFTSELSDGVLRRASRDEWADGLLDLLVYLREHRAQLRSVVASLSLRSFERFLYLELRTMMSAVADDVQGDLVLAEGDRDFIVDHFTVAVVGHVMHWIATDMAAEPYRLVADLEFILHGTAREAMERFAGRRGLDCTHDP